LLRNSATFDIRELWQDGGEEDDRFGIENANPESISNR
jgi:hypothetical protein